MSEHPLLPLSSGFPASLLLLSLFAPSWLLFIDSRAPIPRRPLGSIPHVHLTTTLLRLRIMSCYPLLQSFSVSRCSQRKTEPGRNYPHSHKNIYRGTRETTPVGYLQACGSKDGLGTSKVARGKRCCCASLVAWVRSLDSTEGERRELTPRCCRLMTTRTT